MTSDEAQAIIATCGMTPNSKSFAETEEYRTNYPLSVKFINFLDGIYDNAMLAPATEKFGELQNAFIETGQRMFGEDGADPQAELDELAEEMKDIMRR
jgi:ABC-type glycerol-3-phosphate transport system substrate-binding protein